MPLAVPLIAAGIGAAGSIYASNQANKAANKQIAAQTAATDQSIALQRDALNRQQQNFAPYLQTGYGALQQIQQQFGLGTGGGGYTGGKTPGGFAGTSPAEGGGGGAAAGGQPDWNEYLSRYTDVAGAFNEAAGTPEGRQALADKGISTPQQYAQFHYETFGQRPDENRTVQMTPAAAGPGQEAQTFGPQVPGRESYVRPNQGSAPAMPDLSAAAYQKSPGFEAGLLSGQRNLNANFAARGLLGSGAGAEAAIKFGTDYQNQDYNAWRNNELAKWQQQTQQFNLDRANTNANFGSDRAYGTGVFDADRGYDTSRFDQQLGNLFNLAQLGNPSAMNGAIQSNANNVGGLLQTGANNLSNIYGQQAQNTGGLIGNLAGIGQGLLGNMGGGSLGSLFGGGGGGSNLNWSQAWGGGS